MTRVLYVAALIAAITIVYWKGLIGPFLLDDIPNLAGLSDVAGGGLSEFFDYISNGIAGPSGRVISLATFAVQADSWPNNPSAFKIANLTIHLLSTTIIFWIFREFLLLIGESEDRTFKVALFAAALWALNPLQLTVILYVVQRMAGLSALFVLSGLLLYLHGRGVLERDMRRGLLWMSVAICAFTPLAVLSKENGILLPLMAFTLEFVISGNRAFPKQPLARVWRILFLYLPASAPLIYLIILLPDVASGYEHRPFTLDERLLTQARLVAGSFKEFFIPTVAGRGIFYDDISVSKNLFSPITTFASVSVLTAGLAFAIIRRTHNPLVSIAILFFLAGHVLESSIIPLELFFEHRNYLPTVFLGLPIAALAIHSMRIVRIFPVVLTLCYGGITWSQAQVWSDELLFATTIAEERPLSLRAQTFAASVWQARGEIEKAHHYIEQAITIRADSAIAQMLYLESLCLQGSLKKTHIENALVVIRQANYYEPNASDAIKKLGIQFEKHTCSALSADVVDQLIDAVLVHPMHREQITNYRNLMFYKANLYRIDGRLTESIDVIDQALRVAPDVDLLLYRATWLASDKRFTEARQSIQVAESVAAAERPTKRQISRKKIGLASALVEQLEHDFGS